MLAPSDSPTAQIQGASCILSTTLAPEWASLSSPSTALHVWTFPMNPIQDSDAQIAHLMKHATDYPFDRSAWISLLQKIPSKDLFEKCFTRFPTDVDFWCGLALFEWRQGMLQEAMNTFKRGLNICRHYRLWLMYLQFVYQHCSAHNYVECLEKAQDEIGLDYRSGPIWVELATLKIKIYNCLISVKVLNQNLLFDPFQMNPKSISSPLIPSEVEKTFFLETIPTKKISYVEEYSDVTIFRKFLHQYLSTAVENLENIWLLLCYFERNVGANHDLPEKFIAKMEPQYLLAKAVYSKLRELYSGIDFSTRNIPLSIDCGHNLTAQNTQWKKILDFEKSNPLDLKLEDYQHRVSFSYQLCLLSCAFHADIWLSYFYFLQSQNLIKTAVEVLRKAINLFLPSDELLKLILAKCLEEEDQIKEAEAIYHSLINFPFSNNSQEKQPLANDCCIIHYLAFVRRNFGETVWRTTFLNLVKTTDLSWKVFYSQALTEWRRSKSRDAAIQTMELAYQKFHLDVAFISVYSNFLMEIGEIHVARELLHSAVIDIHKCTNEYCWPLLTMWLNMEQLYGDNQSFQEARSVKIDLLANHELKLRKAHLTDTLNFASQNISKNETLEHYETLVMSQSMKIHTIPPENFFEALVNIRKRIFAEGDEVNNLISRFRFEGSYPKTSVIEYESNQSTSAASFPSTPIQSSTSPKLLTYDQMPKVNYEQLDLLKNATPLPSQSIHILPIPSKDQCKAGFMDDQNNESTSSVARRTRRKLANDSTKQIQQSGNWDPFNTNRISHISTRPQDSPVTADES